MVKLQRYRTAALVLGAGVALSGCVAAVPATQTTLTVIPGQGKTAENLHADDAACRGTGSVGASVAATAPTLNAAAVTSEQYYACMASRGEAVIEQQTQVYPTYAAYSAYAPAGYPAYAYGSPYGYGYPYAYGYPYGGGYPYYGYGGGYFGPYVGFGIGFGYGGFYGRGYGGRGFGYGGYRGGYGGFRGGYGGYGGGFHGGGFRR